MTKHILYLVFAIIPALLFSEPAQADSLDNNIWVYHNLFVERFGMDPENVDNTLSGARGVAIRLVPLARQRCHQTDGGKEKCVPSWQWLMDIYIDIDQDIGIEGDSPRQFKPWRSSLYFLARRNPELRKRWEEVFGLKGGKLYLEDDNNKKNKKETRREVPFEIFAYKRPIKEGLMMIQARINEEIILADPAKKRIIEFSDSSGNVLHRITLPQSYWPRVAGLRAKYASITEKNWKGGVEKDPHIWVYTKEFASKYKLPEENISDDMEGAMAMAFRQDTWGTFTSIEFSDPEYQNMPEMSIWDVYLPENAKLYYADPAIDNFYKGFHPSDIFLHEKTNRSDWRGIYPHLVAAEGLKNGGAHIYRKWIYKRKFKIFNWVKTDKLTRWYGGPISNQYYIQSQVLQAGFIFVGELNIWSRIGEDQYLVFEPTPGEIRVRDLYYSKYYKARIPKLFMKNVLDYKYKYDEQKRAVIKLMEKRPTAKKQSK